MIENIFKYVQTKENNPVAEELIAHENRCYTPNVPKKEWLKEPPFLAKEVEREIRERFCGSLPG